MNLERKDDSYFLLFTGELLFYCLALAAYFPSTINSYSMTFDWLVKFIFDLNVPNGVLTLCTLWLVLMSLIPHKIFLSEKVVSLKPTKIIILNELT
jgi:hypothetical protein